MTFRLPLPTRNSHVLLVLCFIAGLCLLGGGSAALGQEEAGDPPEVTIGERLFLETRFAQFFKTFLDTGGQVNDPLPAGDPTMETSVTTGEPLPGSFAGQSMNCRACHLVDEQLETARGGMRTYADFARRSPVPVREDGKRTTPRNSPPLVNASLPRPGGLLLHFDAEFSSLEELIRSTYTGRNFGWLPNESLIAVAHIARVIREDDGTGGLAQDFGGLPYSVVLTGADPSIPAEFLLPEAFRVNPATATDREIFDAVAKLVSAYTESLVFSQDEKGNFNLSPFDVFLEKNGLPRQPAPRETPLEYSRRLLKLVERLDQGGNLQWVAGSHRKRRRGPHHHGRHVKFVKRNPNTDDGKFQFHDQPFKFGREELEGFKIFFTEPDRGFLRQADIQRGKIGNCIACHQAPNFTDFKFHNTGTTQIEYERLHGPGAFTRLHIPELEERNARHDEFLPATPQHPHAKEIFRSVPAANDPRLTDLGLWNIFANPDFPEPQRRIKRILCEAAVFGTASAVVETPDLPPHLTEHFDRLMDNTKLFPQCSLSRLLPKSVALFKTPGLRDLGHSAPYMHNGQFDSLDDVIGFYRGASNQARAGTLRNGDPQIQQIALTANDVAPLVAFLQALNEDYE